MVTADSLPKDTDMDHQIEVAAPHRPERPPAGDSVTVCAQALYEATTTNPGSSQWKDVQDGPIGNQYRKQAAIMLGALTTCGYAIVHLPAPHHIRVSAINMHPEYEDPDDTFGPLVQCRFSPETPEPGRLFDRTDLAAALLAAERAETAHQ